MRSRVALRNYGEFGQTRSRIKVARRIRKSNTRSGRLVAEWDRDILSFMCDSLVVRGPRTTDGATLFAKNSDRRGREVQPFVQFPAALHSRGSSLSCTHIEIDQVAETYRVMGHSPAWCWGFEQGVE